MDPLLDEERSGSTSSSSLSAGPPPVGKCPSTPGNKCRGSSERVPEECDRPPRYSSHNQRDKTSAALSRPEGSTEEINIEDSPKASQERPILAPPSFAPHPGLSDREVAGGVTRTRARAVSSYDKVRWQQHGEELTGKGSHEAIRHGGWKSCTGADVSESTVQRVQLTSTAAATSERQSIEDSAKDGFAGSRGKDRREGEPSTESERERVAGVISTHQDFGLRRWKEYAVLRHGNNRRFSKSRHGREILFEIASTIREQEVKDLQLELQETRVLAEELHNALRAEQADKAKLQLRVFFLEREVERMEFALRQATASAGDPRRQSPAELCRPNGATSDAPSVTTSAYKEEETQGRVAGGGFVGGGDNLLKRVRETADLEKSELRRRHNVEMSKKQSRIAKMELETKKLEAERDGYRRAAETQAELLSGGYSELRACLEELKTRPRSQSAITDACQWDPHSTENVQGVGDSMTSMKIAHASAPVMRVTEEGLHHQVRTLQSLLLEAVAAAVPTVIMPSTVKDAVDSIRQGVGQIPQALALESQSSVIYPSQPTLIYPPKGSPDVVYARHRCVDENAAAAQETVCLSQTAPRDQEQSCSQHSGEGEARSGTLATTPPCLGICKGGSAGSSSSHETAQEKL